MKNIWKQTLLISVALGGVALFVCCTPKEELNLPGFPGAQSALIIAGTEAQTQINVNAAYDAAGELTFDSPMVRTYVISISTARPDDVVFTCEPYAVNIPADKISISTRVAKIPAGHTSVNVIVGFVGDNMDFIRDNITVQEYELGLKIVGIAGNDVTLSNTEAKVKVSKQAYTSTGSISNATNHVVRFTRAYMNGAIINPTGMEYQFTAKLDRPAMKDVTVDFAATGLATAFAKDMVLTPAKVVIPAGKIESEQITWTLKDDFLLTTTQMEEHNIVLTASFTCEDPTFQTDKLGGDVITFNVKKIFDVLRETTGVSADWSIFPRAGWIITGGSSGSGPGDGPAALIDGKLNTSFDGKATLWFTVDMLAVNDIKGFALRYYNNTTSNSIKTIKIYTSDDNLTWASIGSVVNAVKSGSNYYDLAGSISSRYLKVEALSGWTNNVTFYISEFEVYGAKL